MFRNCSLIYSSQSRIAIQTRQNGLRKIPLQLSDALGSHLASSIKVLKCAKDDDVCMLRAGDDGDVAGV
jgi:proliferating cell nuclear antigen